MLSQGIPEMTNIIKKLAKDVVKDARGAGWEESTTWGDWYAWIEKRIIKAMNELLKAS